VPAHAGKLRQKRTRSRSRPGEWLRKERSPPSEPPESGTGRSGRRPRVIVAIQGPRDSRSPRCATAGDEEQRAPARRGAYRSAGPSARREAGQSRGWALTVVYCVIGSTVVSVLLTVLNNSATTARSELEVMPVIFIVPTLFVVSGYSLEAVISHAV
jgi:hypothetical protein